MSRSFNGTTDYISAGDASTVDITTSTYSVAMWVKYTTGGKGGAKWDDPSALQYLIQLGTNVTIAADDGVGGFAVHTGSVTTNDNAWHLIVFRSNAGAASLRIDGANDGSPGTFPTVRNTAAPLLIGSGGDPGTALEDPYAGLVSRFAVWKTTHLTNGQADDLLTHSPNDIGVAPDFWTIDHNNTTPTDLSGGGVSLSISGTTYDSSEPFVEGGGGGQPMTKRWGGVAHMGTTKLAGGVRGGVWGMDRHSGLIVPRRLAA